MRLLCVKKKMDPLTIAGLALSAIQAGAGIYKTFSDNKKYDSRLDEMQDANEQEYARKKYGDYTRSRQAQAMLSQLRDTLKTRNSDIAGSAAVTGATDEAVAAEKARNAEIINSATNGIDRLSEQYKDRAIYDYIRQRDAINSLKLNKSANGINAGSALMSAAVNALGSTIKGIGNEYLSAGSDAPVSSGNDTPAV